MINRALYCCANENDILTTIKIRFLIYDSNRYFKIHWVPNINFQMLQVRHLAMFRLIGNSINLEHSPRLVLGYEIRKPELRLSRRHPLLLLQCLEILTINSRGVEEEVEEEEAEDVEMVVRGLNRVEGRGLSGEGFMARVMTTMVAKYLVVLPAGQSAGKNRFRHSSLFVRKPPNGNINLFICFSRPNLLFDSLIAINISIIITYF